MSNLNRTQPDDPYDSSLKTQGLKKNMKIKYDTRNVRQKIMYED